MEDKLSFPLARGRTGFEAVFRLVAHSICRDQPSATWLFFQRSFVA
jgi:hypothetical protein